MYNALHPEEIIRIVCQTLEVPDITSPLRGIEFTYARFIAVRLLLKHTRLSYEEIGRFLDRDKTTIYWAEARSKELVRNKDSYFISKWTWVNEKIDNYKPL
ncbi:MAG: helix-turn-helix domain-containing protein [Candidatus Pedobacter colombiensis]|uniref:Helix-turn-helix domain-containing protein n=1 Tax=Candidatus Pedobacter colombiensis TaxID=3121371 RepID=A0AAJ5W570_9SPHI|nr:helix-turn-helix domain-containing protein [Pedobacter sp.]WEK18187.1 MAG: helix-turn-helix domain-containing protein [Pedobacter sp.]